LPELPEVETIARSLRVGGICGPSIVGREFRNAEILWKRTLAAPSIEEFHDRIQNQIIHDVGRRGKFIIIHLSQEKILFHLRMSGDLRVELPQREIVINASRLPHDRAVFYFQDGVQLIFNDPRKFGRIWLLEDIKPLLGILGPEPLDPAFSAHDLYQKLQKSRSRLKPLLMNQRFIAGMGNIYTDEALFVARLHPLIPANIITLDQTIQLHKAIQQVLLDGIQSNGASIDWVYRGGEFQNKFRVYQRTGEPCLVCGTPISRVVIGQRSSHFCPNCQQLKIKPGNN
jgi:formamidopyrimidine-DNA glycosylase